VNASEGSENSEPESEGVLEAEVDEAIATCGGDVRARVARYADRERIPGDRNTTIDRSNLNGLRAGADAQGTSAAEEDLDVDVAEIVGSGVLSCNDYD
jgi:hypothetical protein